MTRTGARDPETKALPVVAGALVLTGTLFYWRFEDWTIIEAHYFFVVTLTTVGFGDLSPTTAGTQIFTIVYILTGFGVLVALLTSVARLRPRSRLRQAVMWRGAQHAVEAFNAAISTRSRLTAIPTSSSTHRIK